MCALINELSIENVKTELNLYRHGLPEGYYERPARVDDAAAVVEMLNANTRYLLGVEKYVARDFENDWMTPGFNLGSDSRLVLTPDRKVVAYYEVWDAGEPHVHIYCWGRVHPEHTGLGIGSHLLQWAERRARMAIPNAPPEARVVLRGHVVSIDEDAQELFRHAGFALTRHSLQMLIELNGKRFEPRWPEGIDLRSFIPGLDEYAVFKAIYEAFRDHWGFLERPEEEEFARWKHRLETDEDFDASLWFLAVEGEEIAGVSLCRPKAENNPGMGWVSTLGVRRPWRQRGLGLALLQHSFLEFQRRGKRKVGLGVDAQSLTGATRLYLKAGMRPETTRQHSLYEKELRPGVELGTQQIEAG